MQCPVNDDAEEEHILVVHAIAIGPPPRRAGGRRPLLANYLTILTNLPRPIQKLRCSGRPAVTNPLLFSRLKQKPTGRYGGFFRHGSSSVRRRVGYGRTNG